MIDARQQAMEEIAYAPKYPKVKLPHPFLTSYRVAVAKDTTPAALCLVKDNTTDGKQLPEPLHLESLWWLDLVWQPKEQVPPLSNNWPYARAQRSPETRFSWQEKAIPTLGQIWGVTHAIFVAHPACEGFRLNIQGAEEQNIRHVMLATGLAIPHPTSPNGEGQDYVNELFVLRSAFWQGAASPIGPRPIWLCEDTAYGKDRAHYPLLPETFHFTTKFPKEPIHTYHPRRPQKPRPGSIVYSRYVPEIDEHFSLEAVNWQDEEHLRLFNTWHNDPRVAAGWNETGTMDEHRAYLKKLNDDPHVICFFGRFDNIRFAYYEIYWAKGSILSFMSTYH